MNNKSVVLIANTGMGNFVLDECLCIKNIKIKLVITNKFQGRYPYYKIKELFRFSRSNGIKTLCNVNVNSLDVISEIKRINPDYVIVASFNQIFKKSLLNIKTKFINLHPSLLPHYRGPAPIHWALLNGESQTGITAHFIDEGIDTGEIIRSRKISINKNDTINKLIKKVHFESGLLIRDLFFNSELLSSNQINHFVQSKYYKKPIGLDIISPNDDLELKTNKIRAFGFFPGISINGNVIKVRSYKIAGDFIEVTDINRNKIIL